jgi:hypothetical protein
MLVAMTAFVHVWFADILVNGMAGLAVCLVVYLLRLELRQKREQRKLRQERGRQRRGHWGYE